MTLTKRTERSIHAGLSTVEGSDAIDVSVVLPVYNERGHLRREIGRIRRSLAASRYSYEIIVVDDGSTDGTASDLTHGHDTRLLRLSRNRGTGAARRVGTQSARGRAVVWTDADMTYPNDLIPELVANLEGHDQVVGARTSEEGTQRLLRIPAKWLIRKLASYLLRTPIPDLNSGFRAFRRDVGLQFMNVLPDGFSCVTTITMAFIANGYDVRYVPIPYAKRAGSSKFRPWKDTKRYLTQVVRMIVGYEPLRIFVPAALALVALSIVGFVHDAVADIGFGVNPLVTAMAALNVLMLGFLVDAVVRMNKPKTQVRSAAVADLDARRGAAEHERVSTGA